MLPFEVIALDESNNAPTRLTKDEESYAAVAIVIEATKRRIEQAVDKYVRSRIDQSEIDTEGFKAYLETELTIIYQEQDRDRTMTLEQLAAKYPQETADVIAQIMLNRADWRPFLPERRVYILGTENYHYLHPAKESV